jgi:hypothetical protein
MGRLRDGRIAIVGCGWSENTPWGVKVAAFSVGSGVRLVGGDEQGEKGKNEDEGEHGAAYLSFTRSLAS